MICYLLTVLLTRAVKALRVRIRHVSQAVEEKCSRVGRTLLRVRVDQEETVFIAMNVRFVRDIEHIVMHGCCIVIFH